MNPPLSEEQEKGVARARTVEETRKIWVVGLDTNRDRIRSLFVADYS
jgi:hypothetical protein